MQHDEFSKAHDNECPDFQQSLVASFCRGLDIMMKEIDEQFSSSGLADAVEQEELLVKAAIETTALDMHSIDLLNVINLHKLGQLRQLHDFLKVEEQETKTFRNC